MQTAALRLQPHLSATCHRLTCPPLSFRLPAKNHVPGKEKQSSKVCTGVGSGGCWQVAHSGGGLLRRCQEHVPSGPAASTGWPSNLLCGAPVGQVSSTVLELQRLLPRARFVYCSATGVSEVGGLQLVGLDWLRLSWLRA